MHVFRNVMIWLLTLYKTKLYNFSFYHDWNMYIFFVWTKYGYVHNRDTQLGWMFSYRFHAREELSKQFPECDYEYRGNDLAKKYTWYFLQRRCYYFALIVAPVEPSKSLNELIHSLYDSIITASRHHISLTSFRFPMHMHLFTHIPWTRAFFSLWRASCFHSNQSTLITWQN